MRVFLNNMRLSTFGNRLIKNENAELVSIYEYIAVRMSEILNRVKIYIDSRLSIAHGHDDIPMAERLLHSQLSRLLEDTDASRPETIIFLVNLGLPFCRRFFVMPVPRQAAVIDRYHTTVHLPSLAHTLAHCTGTSIYTQKYEPYSYTFFHHYARSSTCVHPHETGIHDPGDERDERKEIEKYKRNIEKSHYGLGRAGIFFWDDERINDLWNRGRFGWLHYIGCFFWKEALRSGLEAGASRADIEEDFNDDAIPWELLPGDEIIEEEDDQDSDDDDFTRAERKRKSQRPDVKRMPLERLVEAEIDLEIDSFDY